MTFVRPAWSRVGHIRGRLIGLVIVAALPIIAMAATIAWQDYQAVARGAQDRATLLDGQVLANYHSAIAKIAGDIQAFTLRTAGGQCDGGLPGDVVDPSVSIVAAAADGQTICRIGPAVTFSSSDPWFGQIRSGASEVVARLAADGRIVVAVPSNGGVAFAAMPADGLITRAVPNRFGEEDAVWLMDGDRTVIAAHGAAAAAFPTPATMMELTGAAQTALRASAATGARYAYATTLLPSGWRLVAATSGRREHDQAVRELMLRLVELTVLLVVGLAAVILGADVAFGHPLRRLSRAVRRWQGGAPFDPGDLTGAPEEVLQLARSFHDATGDLRQREQELVQAKERQDLLVLEIHHRVKNNLQVIASLLNLQASRIRVPEARAEFQAARDRVRALATLHRHLYADGELHTINMRSFLTELCGQLFQAMGEKEGARIQLTIEAPELRMSSDQAVPLALIVTEAVTNSVRYAFPGGRTGHIAVELTDRLGELDLVISDNGVGIPAGKADTELGTRDGIGLQLIRGFSRQLGATLTVEEGAGTRYAVRLIRDPARSADDLDAPPMEQDNAA